MNMTYFNNIIMANINLNMKKQILILYNMINK